MITNYNNKVANYIIIPNNLKENLIVDSNNINTTKLIFSLMYQAR